jgi:ABC-type uncharacterized transport system YnjBCD substrate-binding protein
MCIVSYAPSRKSQTIVGFTGHSRTVGTQYGVGFSYTSSGKRKIAKRSYEMASTGKKKRGRPKLTWAEGIKALMGEKGLMEEDWNDRCNWRKKIIQLSNGRRKM